MHTNIVILAILTIAFFVSNIYFINKNKRLEESLSKKAIEINSYNHTIKGLRKDSDILEKAINAADTKYRKLEQQYKDKLLLNKEGNNIELSKLRFKIPNSSEIANYVVIKTQLKENDVVNVKAVIRRKVGGTFKDINVTPYLEN